MAAATVLVTLLAWAAGAAAHAGPARGYSLRALVSQAQADLAGGRPGRALLAFERAQLLAPRAPAVVAGLAQARTAASLPTLEGGLAMRSAERLSPNEWSWIAMAGFGLGAAGLVAFAWALIRRGGLVTLVSAGAAIAGVALLAAMKVAPPPNAGVVISSGAVARIAPFDGADTAFLAPEGASVSVEGNHGDYLLVAADEGRGWVTGKSVETILPANGHIP